MSTAIIIPARYNSSRFPGKPLAILDDKSILQHVYDSATKASSKNDTVVVATEDERIEKHCKKHDMRCVMTSEDCETGTDRIVDALDIIREEPEYIVNLQGDAPFTPPAFIRAVLDTLAIHKEFDIVTPVEQLSWDALDKMRIHKAVEPFSGTTAILGEGNKALWFSKQILPAIRNESEFRKKSNLSPVCRHIGLYGFKRESLERYAALEPSRYEKLEGLEQLRALQAGMNIKCIFVDYKGLPSFSGIDTPEDLEQARKILKEHGEWKNEKQQYSIGENETENEEEQQNTDENE